MKRKPRVWMTVVLKYPDSMTGSDDEYYVARVMVTRTARRADGGMYNEAVSRARAKAILANSSGRQGTAWAEGLDFAVVSIFRGRLIDYQCYATEK